MMNGESMMSAEISIFGEPLSHSAKEQFAQVQIEEKVKRAAQLKLGVDVDALARNKLKEEEIHKKKEEKTRRLEAEKEYDENLWWVTCTTQEMQNIATDAAEKYPKTDWGKFIIAGVMQNRRDSGSRYLEHPVTKEEAITLMEKLNQRLRYHDGDDTGDDSVLSEEEISDSVLSEEEISDSVLSSVLHESRTRTQRCLEIWTQTRTHWTHESGHVSSFGWSGEYCPIKMKEWVSNLFRHHSSMFLGNFNVITRFDSFSINF
jgi:hypothetical protein